MQCLRHPAAARTLRHSGIGRGRRLHADKAGSTAAQRADDKAKRSADPDTVDSLQRRHHAQHGQHRRHDDDENDDDAILTLQERHRSLMDEPRQLLHRPVSRIFLADTAIQRECIAQRQQRDQHHRSQQDHQHMLIPFHLITPPPNVYVCAFIYYNRKLLSIQKNLYRQRSFSS